MNSYAIREAAAPLLREAWIGSRVEIVNWGDAGFVDEESEVPLGTQGVVSDVDDIGTLHVDWDNGRRIGMIPGVDVFREVVT